MYQNFGKDALPIISEVCRMQGKSLGLKISNKLPDNKLSTVATAFLRSYDPKLVKGITISDEKFRVQGTKCPFGLENTSRELCQAVMAIDLEYFRTAVNQNIQLKIIKTLAEGASICDTLYYFNEDIKY